MQDIDFLPAKYRDLSARRNIKLSRVVVVGAIVLALVGAAVTQSTMHRRLVAEIDSIKPLHEAAEEQSRQLAATQAELEKQNKIAELLTYMRHPWPRTQLLSAVIQPLPESLSLDEITISFEKVEVKIATPTSRRQRKPTNRAQEEAAAESLTSAERDLKQLRESSDTMQTVIIVAGRTRDRTALYKYLAELDDSELIVKAELMSFEAAPDRAVTARGQKQELGVANEIPTAKFIARLVVLRAHDQALPKDENSEPHNT